MGNLLFNPNGRIARQRFWQGMIVLTVASVVVSAGAWLIHPSIGLLSYALIFPYICVYGKRLHDAGQSAWWVIAIWISAVIVQVIVLIILMFTVWPAFMSPEQKEIFREVMELSEQGDTAEAMKGVEILMTSLEGLMQRSSLFLMVATNALFAMIIGFLKTDPRENKHGPIPGTSAADMF